MIQQNNYIKVNSVYPDEAGLTFFTQNILTQQNIVKGHITQFAAPGGQGSKPQSQVWVGYMDLFSLFFSV